MGRQLSSLYTLNRISGRKGKVGLESRAFPTRVCVCVCNCKWFREAIRLTGGLLHSLDDRGHEARELEQKGPRVGLGPGPAHRECHFSHTSCHFSRIRSHTRACSLSLSPFRIYASPCTRTAHIPEKDAFVVAVKDEALLLRRYRFLNQIRLLRLTHTHTHTHTIQLLAICVSRADTGANTTPSASPPSSLFSRRQ